MLLIVGLGNPGPQYVDNRHNIGFHVIDALRKEYDFPAYSSKFDALLSIGQIEDQKVVLLKPLTYMNLSGKSVGECARYFHVKPEDVIVIHDEIDIPFGKIKAKQGGGTGGHNGLKSIDAHIGPNYYRIRFGVGKPVGSKAAKDHVLKDFSKTEREELPHMIGDILAEFPKMMAKETAKFLNGIALRRQQVK